MRAQETGNANVEVTVALAVVPKEQMKTAHRLARQETVYSMSWYSNGNPDAFRLSSNSSVGWLTSSSLM